MLGTHVPWACECGRRQSTLNRSPRRKPTRVIRNLKAISTARLEGAPDGDHDRNSSHQSFLNQLEAGPSADQNHGLAKWEPRPQKFGPINLSTALCRPTSSRRLSKFPEGSNSAAACNPPVWSKTDDMAQGVGQTRNCGQVDQRRLRGQRKADPRMYCPFDRDLSADSTAGRHVKIPLKPLEVTIDSWPQFDGDAVAPSISVGYWIRGQCEEFGRYFVVSPRKKENPLPALCRDPACAL